MKQTIDCPECGGVPVIHILEKLTSWLDHYTSPFNILGNKVIGLTRMETFGSMWVFLVKGLFIIGEQCKLGLRIEEVDNNFSYRSRVMWEAAQLRGVRLTGFKLNSGRILEIFLAITGEGKRMVFESLPRPIGKRNAALSWMDNKGKLKIFLYKHKIPVSAGKMVTTWKEAQKVFKIINKPVVVKPADGSRSRHTTINISTLDNLKIAFKSAKKLSHWIMVEEQLEGFVYRATVIGGKTAGVMRRLPAGVYGNGKLSVRELVAHENAKPLRQGPIFHKIALGEAAMHELERQDLNLDSVPEKNRFVVLHPKVGRSIGAGNIDVTDLTHKENLELFEQIAKVLNEPLLGIDFIIPNIEESWRLQKKLGVIEVNSLPFIDLHHYPLEGEVRDVAGALWDLVLESSK